MRHKITNGILTMEAESKGAEIQYLSGLGSGPNGWLWNAGEIWPRYAPLCFPWGAKLLGGWHEVNGKRYIADQHGFARDLEHKLVEQQPDRLHFQLKDNEYTKERFPWSFILDTVHTIEGNTLVTACTVTNTDKIRMPVRFGFHTALLCPFTAGKKFTDYQFRFEKKESAVRVICKEGLTTGEEVPIFTNQDVVPLEAGMFDDDSICLKGLKSKWVQLEEKATGKALRHEIWQFGRVVLWTKPNFPGFICIEPWDNQPGLNHGDTAHDLMRQPCVKILEPGELYTWTQKLSVIK